MLDTLHSSTDILVISVLFTKVWSVIFWLWKGLLNIICMFCPSVFDLWFSLLFLILARTERNSAESESRIVWEWMARQLQEKIHSRSNFFPNNVLILAESWVFFEKLFFLLSTLTASLGWDRITVCRDKSNWDSETKE